MSRFPLFVATVAFMFAATTIACDDGAVSVSPGSSSRPGATSGSADLEDTTLTVGLGYIPSVQFAQFYRAQLQGYYQAAGLEITFQNQIDPDLIALLGQGTVDIGVADGTSIIPAVGQNIPVRYVATIYSKFPNVVVTSADSGIEEAADLRDKSIGIPGRYGSSWIMLQALLDSADMTPDDVEVREYPDFGQSVALKSAQVDAATGFANNEPVQLADQGFPAYVLTIDEITPLPGPGLAVGERTLTDKPNAVRAFVAATLQAMREIAENPEVGLEDAITAVPELAADRALQLSILQATIETWKSPYTDQHGLGAIDPAAWQASLDFMRGLPDSNIPETLTVDELISEDMLP
ncbi:MAG: ABC transporter substrate-binding protein [Candidatus Limnocylindrales bacterium]